MTVTETKCGTPEIQRKEVPSRKSGDANSNNFDKCKPVIERHPDYLQPSKVFSKYRSRLQSPQP
jgi:hypothetical protein